MSSWDALYLSYAIAWGGLFLYLLYLHRRLGRLATQLKRLEGGKSPEQ